MDLVSDFKKGICQLSETWAEQDSRNPNERKTSRVIFDTIYGGIYIQGYLVDLLDRPPMQRLRWIKQLGASEMLYPTGTHSRFEHSLGTYYIAQQMLIWLKRTMGEKYVTPDDENNVLAAALLHDVGHLCFSHTGELFLDYCSSIKELAHELKADISIHEYIGYEILGCNYFRELIRRINNQYGLGLDIERIRKMIVGISTNTETQFLADIIHGPIDADRIDYLSRDAYNVGFPHIIDVQRLINTITVVEYKLGVKEKGTRAVESLFLARDRLRPTLYEHHVSRVSEEFLIRIMKEVVNDPFNIIGIDDFELFFKLRSCEKVSELLEDYKNRKFHKRFLFFQCIDDELREKVVDTTLEEKIEIEKEISETLWNKKDCFIKDCCIMVVPKTREKTSIGEVLVKLRDGSVEKASVAMRRLYHPRYKRPGDLEDLSDSESDLDNELIEKCETHDIRLFVPWNRVGDPSLKEREKVKKILAEKYDADSECFQEGYSPKEYKGYSI